ncbi:MAG TPA: hypothetical protein VFB62_16765 [Polyangiaceae bacterium]|nr:hypothetical protein [Polyangiaceae bacterium]
MRIASVLVAFAMTACLGDVGDESSTTGQGGASSTSTSSSNNTSTGSAGAPPCSAANLSEAVRISDVAVDGASASALYAPSPSGGWAAWAGSDGQVHLTPLDAVDARAGDDLLIEALAPFGLVASASELSVLVSRSPDYMTFMRLDTSGNVVASVDLVGGGNHNNVGTEWFGEFARTGRLVEQNPGEYAAYFALHRRWPDNIGHQGDTLRLLDASGQPRGGGWDWGCSHSIDQRIAASAGQLAPICIADCYPGKGIYFNHDQAQIIDDPSANCAGGVSTTLGGLISSSDGSWLSYAKDGNYRLAKLDGNGQTTVDLELPSAMRHRLATYEGDLLLAYEDGSGVVLERRDPAGAAIGAAETISGIGLPPEHDLASLENGDVAWAFAQGTTLSIVRLRSCD